MTVTDPGGGDARGGSYAPSPANHANSDSESDFELARPAAEATLRSRSSTASRPVRSDTDGDFELERPAGAGGNGTAGEPGGSSAEPRSDEWGSTEPGSAEAESAVSASASADTAVASAPPSGATRPLSASDAPSGGPKPLHDPDPYRTPPYGEPGPWAPAPPVQHPATTPAHGTTPGTGRPAPAVLTEAGAQPHDEVAPADAPTRRVPTAATLTEAASATPLPASVPPEHETPVPATAQQPATATLYADAPGPGAAAHPPVASYAYPSQPGPPPFGDSAQAVPPSYAGGAPPAPAAYTDGSPPAPAAYADPARPHPTAPQGPWRNYDPWAGSGSLQQNGAAVDGGARRRRRGRGLLVGAVLIAVVAGGIGGAVGAYLERNGGVGAVELPQTGDGVTGRAPDSVAGIAAGALPGVVTLHVSGASAQGTGTGFVLDERGHILTNNHVVDPAGTDGEISVTFSGGETAKATVVGRDTGYDLAVVKVSGVRGLEPLPLGNSEEVRVGDPVVAIGAPFDLANTVTSGIISAKERPITAGGESGDVSDVSYVDALQTDAPINPGNSGGPLLDGKGRVIGINSAIRSAGGGSESDGGQAGSIGLGFAIPINQGKRVAEELINTGKASHPVIGVTLDMDYSGDGARIGAKGDSGAAGVTEGGPADRAGIRPGDVITEVDGQRVHSGDELIVKVRAHRPGDRLELTLLRDGSRRTVTLTLGSSGSD
ncbi:trypsin-like peptidase domain-containing protein [Streptomyces bottropensis]|uniref:S1C family serine protease n=1 Tax=Streptomyces bottropensis TaxID=42235 RepID=UPI00035F560A